eukprot:11184724-Lingulodinium_polyedra.AAC.1
MDEGRGRHLGEELLERPLLRVGDRLPRLLRRDLAYGVIVRLNIRIQLIAARGILRCGRPGNHTAGGHR